MHWRRNFALLTITHYLYFYRFFNEYNLCQSTPFSLESVTLVAEKQGNSAFKHIPHIFSVKLVAKPRYATFLKNALTIALFFTAKLCHGKDVMQACAAGAWYATFFFALILLSHSSLLPKGSGEATVRNISLKC